MGKNKFDRKKWWIGACVTILAAVAVGIALWAGLKKPVKKPVEKPVGTPVRAMAVAQYPKAAKEGGVCFADELQDFFSNSAREFLTDTKGGNLTYSPVNVYMALGMLAELTGGNSRQQILDALGSESIETLRAQASVVWNATYENDIQDCILASSLWLDENVSFHQATMDRLADTYYASAYQGQMGSQSMNQAFQDWLNDQTKDLLNAQIDQLELSPDAVLALATTIYFKAQWSDAFSETATEADTFHGLSGDMTVDFMHQGDTDTYYWSERFGAVARNLRGGGNMWFILPDEGISPEELLSDNAVMALVCHPEDWKDQKYLVIHGAYPKFDVSSQIDLCSGLKKLGITDVFHPKMSDFTPMTEDVKHLFVGEAKHGARVKIDEAGVIAAAYTEMQVWLGAPLPPKDEIDFIVDRPFLFVITSKDSLPLFVGIVHQPVT